MRYLCTKRTYYEVDFSPMNPEFLSSRKVLKVVFVLFESGTESKEGHPPVPQWGSVRFPFAFQH